MAKSEQIEVQGTVINLSLAKDYDLKGSNSTPLKRQPNYGECATIK